MTLKYVLDETKTPRVLTVSSDRGAIDITWAGESAKAIFTPVVSDPTWKLISNDGATAIFQG
jgi:hypothetical protein